MCFFLLYSIQLVTGSVPKKISLLLLELNISQSMAEKKNDTTDIQEWDFNKTGDVGLAVGWLELTP